MKKIKQEDLILVGGSNIDFIASSLSPLIKETSNIGKINISFGGVMKNIAYDLALLNDKFIFFTALGDDLYAKNLIKHLKEMKINFITPLNKGISSSSYLAINDQNNDLYISICDNEVINSLSPSFLMNYDLSFEKAKYILLDANLNLETISHIIDRYHHKKIMVEGVSIEKIKKFKQFLNRIYLLKANLDEIKELFDLKDDNLIENLLKELVNSKVKKAIISNKSEAILYFDGEKINQIKVVKKENIVSSNGAGDALFAGFIHSFLVDEDFYKAIGYGIYLASLVLESKNAYPEIDKLKKV